MKDVIMVHLTNYSVLLYGVVGCSEGLKAANLVSVNPAHSKLGKFVSSWVPRWCTLDA